MNNSRLYRLFVEPRASDPAARNQELVLNWLLVGALGLVLADFINMLACRVFLNEAYPPIRFIAAVGLFGFFAFLLALSRWWQQRVVPAVALVAVFGATAAVLVYQWDIINPVGLLLFGLAIVMAGILLGARFSLYAALLTALILSILTYDKAHHYFSPDLDWTQKPSRFTDVVSFSAIFAILALVSWLFNRQIEMALRQAQRSETALKRQKASLAIKVEQRTRELQSAQLGQIQQFYRFAELGHLSAALFHDLANHLMSVSLDIEGLQKSHPSDVLVRAKQNVSYIDEIVKRVRRQMRGQNEVERFNVVSEIKEVIKMLAYHSGQAQVTIDLQTPAAKRPVMYRGDLIRFRQIIINLLSNGIEAYQIIGRRPGKKQRVVTVVVASVPGNLTITVADQGKGMDPAVKARIFEPFYSTKRKSMGIGLFIVRKVVEEDFGGKISLTSTRSGGTTFTVTLPTPRQPNKTNKGSRG